MLFLTGATGYIGSYLVDELRRTSDEHLLLLVRAGDIATAEQRLWASLQLHMDFDTFLGFVRERVSIVLGDLTAPNLGMDAATWTWVVASTTSVLHCAASLNRKSSKACFNVNLRGTLTVIRLARAAHDDHGLRRFSDISTVAVVGQRTNQTVREEDIVDWGLSDFDPYARTKKFCEHMVHELLPDVPTTVFRPSVVLGDSRFPETTQFDMVRAFVILAQFPVLPLDASWRIDIVPVDYVARAVVSVHQDPSPAHDSYNLSAGEGSLPYAAIVEAMRASGMQHRRPPAFLPKLEPSFAKVVDRLSWTPKKYGVALPASLLKVFLPYLTFNVVFDNTRIVDHLGEAPAPFSEYCFGLFEFARAGNFTYPYKPWPAGASPREGTR
jgi:nucleoside-diphosphate-sugar epimerase